MQVKNKKNERISIRNKMREKLAMKKEEERKRKETVGLYKEREVYLVN